MKLVFLKVSKMSDSGTHIIVGIIFTIAVGLILTSYSIITFTLPLILIISGAIGFISGLSPDLLEPADTPRHRGFWHSWAILGCLILLNYALIHAYSFWWGLFFSIGYMSHLFLDAITPMSLPLV